MGNFIIPKRNTFTTTESIGTIDKERMIEEAKKFPYLKTPLSYNASDYAYVVYDENYSKNVKIIKDYLENIGIYTLGRFGEWTYYNMDKCIESAMKLTEIIKNNQR